MKKRFLSLLMALCLMLTLAPAAFATDVEDVSAEEPVEEALVEEEAEGWDGTTTEEIPSNGEISTAAQLAKLAEDVNAGKSYTSGTFTLTADIDLNNQQFTPIGIYSKPFTGTFDGAGYTIKNATISGSDASVIWAGLFGCVNGGTVQDFTLDNIRVTNTSTASSGTDSEQATSGAAVGILGTGKGGTVDKVIVLDTCSVSGVYRTGGIVGSSRDTNSTISNCVNRATVTGSGNYTGGIVGAAHNVTSASATATGTYVISCVNYGTVTGASEVGGIVGYADRASINSCTNHGAVTGTGNYGTGGILGCDIHNYSGLASIITSLRPTKGSSITNCTNAGTVTAPRAGGILGSFVVAPSKNQPSSTIYSTISECTNTGAVKSQNGNGVCGAIYGAPITYSSGSADSYVDKLVVKIEGCVVGGTVEGISVPASDTDFTAFISPSSHVQLSNNTRYEEAAE